MNKFKLPLFLLPALLPVASYGATVSLVPDDYSFGSFTVETVNGQDVWVATNANSYLYFDVPSSFSFVPGEPVYVEIEYIDDATGRLFVEYDSGYGSDPSDKNYDAEIHTRSSRLGTLEFVKSYQVFENPLFANRQGGGNDFRMRLLNWSGTPLRIASVKISTEIFPDEQLLYANSKPWLQPYNSPVVDHVDNLSLKGKVLAGYQGWFNAPNDLRDKGWNHWGRTRDVDPSPTEITIDMWPWMNDYDPDSIYPVGQMDLGDGRPAYLFSSADLDTVQTHFRWMREYNIDGVYLQRFVSRTNSGFYGAEEFVLHNVREAARLEGRVWALEYDISSLDTDPDPLLVMQNDWNWLVNEAGILDDPRYLHEDGKPVLFIWGFSTNGRDFTVAQANEIVDWFAAQNLYLIGGVPNSWESKTDWFGHYQKYDQLLAWQESSGSELISEKAQLDSWGMKILPHAWPGFSWTNLKKLLPGQQFTPRNGGQFYWDRIKNAINTGADQIFLGMFDEYDEGTAIMPMSDNHPDPHTAWGSYIDNEGRDPFWYLRLSGAAKEMLTGVRPLSNSLPLESAISPAGYMGADATAFLGAVNDETNLFLAEPFDGLTFSATYGGQECRHNELDPNATTYIYFDVDDAFVPGIPGEQTVMIEVEVYVTEANTSVRLQYDSNDPDYALNPNYKLAPDPIAFPKPNVWTTVRWFIDDAAFENSQNGPADFRLNITKGKLAAVRRASVFLPNNSTGSIDPSIRLNIQNGQVVWSDRIDAVGWRLSKSPDLSPGSWLSVPDIDISFLDGDIFYDFDLPSGSEFFRLESTD
ncbi:hypothetical protein G0Q06_03905 [Puniceicoccales bacterium CK1056]|uniref:Uncharacterized protein n=1 Tax=Oceanipulchritudo coccoides TaxID=2706888 RepID=A0A6B2LZT4_9BACT|nr:glycoside hydrolase family 71/99-like protein [Oceanipulchritudo coccoides]NDV61586.1 hypothetical protein [Oceanipulchritudo coccoides]